VNDKNTNFYLIIVAAGSGSRLSRAIPKQYIKINGKTILRHSLDIFHSMPNLLKTCIVINPDHQELYNQSVKGLDNIVFCTGGTTRQDSVHKGLRTIKSAKDDDIILIHDAARPFIKKSEINNLIQAVKTGKAATLGVMSVDTMRRSDKNNIAQQDIERDNLWAIQTPQAFHYSVIKQAHDICNKNKHYTDDSAIISDMGIDVKLIKGSRQNFKITTKEDLHMAEQLLSTKLVTRTGQGFDVHAFDNNSTDDVQNIKLCGVDIEYNRKLKGHSDADVGLHALTDAILGAIAEGDIGLHFPPSNNDFKNMDSAIFLEHAMKLLRDKGGKLINADITLICEEPKIGKYREKIIKRVANILGVNDNCINIKATTTEKLGFTGRKEGVAAQAIVSVTMRSDDNEA